MVRLPLTGQREQKARSRLREHPDQDFWLEVFAAIRASKFLLGTNGKSSWQITLDWLLENDTNAVRVAEGAYVQRGTVSLAGGRS